MTIKLDVLTLYKPTSDTRYLYSTKVVSITHI